MSDKPKKTVEELLEEQNKLLRDKIEQDKWIAAGNWQASERARRVSDWDRQNPVAKYFWINPYAR